MPGEMKSQPYARTPSKGHNMSISDSDWCRWCEASTAILHKHHYPISESKGGTETIDICPSCHCEFHYLQRVKIYTVVNKDISEGAS